MKPVFASLFTGGGLADVGALQAGCELAWGVELKPEIAEAATHNLKHQVICQSVLDCNPLQFEKPDIFWASPPCQAFSIAKTDRAETELDKALAQKIVDFLKVLQPQYFILENVSGYARSDSLAFIEGALYGLGYWIDRQILNSADFSVPQTRKRLILRAVRGGWVPSMPQPQKWVGWYEAIADLIPSLPESQFAEWQLERLPHNLVSTCFVDVTNTIRQSTVREIQEPSPTVTAEKMRRPISTPKAFIVDGAPTDNGQTLTIRQSESPSFTIRASQAKKPCSTWLDEGKVVSMTPRALGRFQSLPDWYELPTNKWAPILIGNGVPCKLAQTAIESLIGVAA